MSFAFFAAALFMTIAAVALVVRPLLREKFKSERRLNEWRLEFKSLIEANSAGSLDSARAIARLADKLRQNPDDAQGWALLGRTYKATQHYTKVRHAFKNAVDAAPEDAGLMREYAAADSEETQPQQCDVPAFGVAGDAASTASACTEMSAPSHGSTRITVEVSIAPKLTAAQLPASVTLTDAMSMMPNLTLSKFSQIVLGARISKSGNASALSGDLQTLSPAVANSQAEPVQLTIDRTVE
jgi:tetratricopeptide (TPR) repeat protein